ncbi:stage 0 sporulation protein [candidate division WOR-3 bacterium]|nr:stage 0 sporulation protein [candidate division WOR-3 bacterium]
MSSSSIARHEGEPLDGANDRIDAAEPPEHGLVELHAFDMETCALPEGMVLAPGDTVVVQDEDGEELGRFVSVVRGEDSDCRILRRATADDLRQRTELDAKTVRVLELFRRLKDEFRLNMRVVGAHWRFDRRRVCFYFVSEERLDFRGLHRAVSSALNARVAIKQIGVRDHARMLGGLGACGRELCCRSFLKEMRPITLRMARQQNLFVEPSKISGLCGKLLCCLSYEDDTYRQLITEMPRIGSRVQTDRGQGVVTSVDVLMRRVRVRYDDDAELAVALEDLASAK